ncbi:serine hydrolase [Leptobacterium flavescens]|uniref:beta-N-acetylhexosaminidase n=1 Tax=Leptobacterium flavescens TaxID=472055 RepID=A0A6P0UQ98_9FLAO|nr:glycoside hydrolase family 3 N-terminal domain-containing protein [Leptobacterium flavescens]NER13999.1 serine hydrolase [Leptobacterium flavescens]
MRKYLFLIHTLFITAVLARQDHPLITKDSLEQQKWVDSIYNSMSLEERVGQLFMVDVFSSKEKRHTDRVKELIREHHIGGVIFSKGGPVRQARLTNEYQELSKIPLMVAMDAEWGLAMRLDSTYAFPWNMTLGAVKDNALIERVGRQIGKHARRLGVHINFAPDIDINTNPNNPIIGNRSFGEDKENVTQKALAFMKGMQSAGALTCGKHFPGHGDTDTDSHKTLPTISFSRERIDSIELYPYRKLIKENLESVMIAHLNVPSLEQRDGYPSSISEGIVTSLLKDTLGFKGLVFTDALNMKGASNFTSPGDIDLAAFLAGNDILLISENIPKGISKIKEAYEKGVITEERLAISVKKILQSKYKVGLNNYKPVETENLVEDLNTLEDDLLHEEVMENALTLAKNKLNLVPVKNLNTKKIAYVELGDDSGDTFLKAMQRYGKVDKVSAPLLNELLAKLRNYNMVVVGFHRSNANPWKSYKFKDKELIWLQEIARNHNVILDIFVKPYALLDIPSIENIESIIVSYQNSDIAQEKSAQLIFGAIEAKGTLPVSAHEELVVNTGLNTNRLYRLQYGIPESVKMNGEKLLEIDSVAQLAIDSLMMPGAQILVARKGKVIYNKNFGKTGYENGRNIGESSIYDVASLTKILATLPMIMKMEEEGRLSMETPLKEMLPEAKGTNKEDITLREMLSHYARLKAWIPYYLRTLDTVTHQPSAEYYRKRPDNFHSIKVIGNLYLRKDFKDTIINRIMESDLIRRKEYRYSDLPYYLLKEYIEREMNTSLDKLVQQNFLASLGTNNTTYNPLEKFSRDKIVPSEDDSYFRYQRIQGYVHDMGAAMQGGVGGHAGLFSNANDVAKIMQMYLQGGYYGGKRYFKASTIDKFNTCYFCKFNNRRGVGFDKPQLEEVGPTCGCVAESSFGHSGFTGTYTWADPDKEIVYVFLSNRTYPTAQNRKLISENIRTVIQQIIYDAVLE